MKELDAVYLRMMDFYRGDPKQIQHFVKVHSFAALIGRGENLEPEKQRTLELAALVHDIGIKPAMEKYGSGSGKLQETEGPPEARKLLEAEGIDEATVERVCRLVSRHHTYTDVDGIDHRILLEADFLVNCYEGQKSREMAKNGFDSIFTTKTGRNLMKVMFELED